MHPTLRLATPFDLDSLTEMFAAYYAFDAHEFHLGTSRAAAERLIADNSLGRLWVILAGDTPAGYAVLGFGYSLEFHGRDAFLDEFYLEEKYRDQGWGSFVLALIEDEARALGIRALHLEVTRGNTRAFHVYEKAGFRDHGRFLMTKWIDPPIPQ